jgi:hypothetical protein
LAILTRNGTLRIVSVRTWKTLSTMTVPDIAALAWSPDSREVATAVPSSAMMSTYQIRGGRRVWHAHLPAEPSSITWSDGLVASGTEDERAVVLSGRTGELINSWRVPGSLGSAPGLGFLPDGSLVAGSRDGTLSRWDPRTGHPLGTPVLVHASAGASDFVVLSDGRVVVASEEGAVLVDPRDPAALPAPLASGNAVWLAVDDRRARVFAVDNIGTLTEADVAPSDWVRYACRLVREPLTRRQWDQYVGTATYAPACNR